MIWQCGNYYYESLKGIQAVGIRIYPFLQHMDLAYAAADVIISRAGAGTIAELCVVGKPVILVPSPNVAEDHQTKNALALAEKEAAIMVRDSEAVEKLIENVISMLSDEKKSAKLSENVKKLALVNADEVIAKEVLKLADKEHI